MSVKICGGGTGRHSGSNSVVACNGESGIGK